jgi:hypothetical protein
MMSVPNAGLIGAAIGLMVGIADYWLIAAIVESRLGRLATDASRETRMARDQQVAWIKRLLFLSTLVVFPAIGYVVGVTIGG